MLKTIRTPDLTSSSNRNFMLLIPLLGVGIGLPIAILSNIQSALGYASLFVVCFLSGFALLSLLNLDSLKLKVLLAPSAGFVLACFVVAIGMIHKLAYWSLTASLLFFSMIGSIVLYRQFSDLKWTNIKFELSIIAVLICMVFIVYGVAPVLFESTLRSDGSMVWRYVDVQFFEAISASLVHEGFALHAPGMNFAKLVYHFGPYGLAGYLSAVLGIEVVDAFPRCVQMVGLVCLVFSTYGMGAGVSKFLDPRGSLYCATGATVGLFFLGSFTALFTTGYDSSVGEIKPFLFSLPYAQGASAPFGHFMLGHSQLWGMIVITLIIGVLFGRRGASDTKQVMVKAMQVEALLPALAVPVNIFAALGMAGLLSLVNVTKNGRQGALNILIILGLFLLSLMLFGVIGNQQTNSTFALAQEVPSRWMGLVIWLFMGLGVRIVAFELIADAKSLVAIVLMGLCAGYGLSYLFLTGFWGSEGYFLYFLQASLSVLSGAVLGHWIFQLRTGEATTEDLLIKVFRIIFNVSIVMIFITVLVFVLTSMIGMLDVRHTIIALSACVITAVAAFIIPALIVRFPLIGTAVKYTFAGLLGLSLLAWVGTFSSAMSPFKKKEIIVATAGEVAGLRKVRALTPPGSLVATNKHEFDGILSEPDRSYIYGLLSERPMLLEGWFYGERNAPAFLETKNDNSLIFSSDKPALVKSIIDKYQIKLIVAKPGTDIQLPDPKPSWLRVVPDTGSLRVYEVVGE